MLQKTSGFNYLQEESESVHESMVGTLGRDHF